MDVGDLSRRTVATLNLPVFDGYPYIVVRLQPAFFHLTVVPSNRTLSELTELARYQAQMNDLPACLVLARDSAFYCEPGGIETRSGRVPFGGTVVHGILEPREDFPQTPELIERRHQLDAFVEGLKQKGYALGDLTKGGRKPNESEARRLAGRQPNGIPLGLSQCVRCGEWRGECVDPNPLLSGLIVRTHCVCENRNCCARCGQLLCDRKVNTNYYCEQDGKVWHVPGFCALRHRCKGGPKWQA